MVQDNAREPFGDEIAMATRWIWRTYGHYGMLPDGHLQRVTALAQIGYELVKQDAALLDSLLTKGEGTVPEWVEELSSPSFYAGTWKWVRVYRGSETHKAIGTFYLQYYLGDPDSVRMLGKVQMRKGLPPNPCDVVEQVFRSWDEGCNLEFAPMSLTKDEDKFTPHRIKGLRPAMSAGLGDKKPYQAAGTLRDVVWKMDGYRVRTPKLVPVLHGFRSAGYQRVPVNAIRKAVERL
ncbi:hypothetical protein [Corynebacterium sp. 11A]|uniref:hypothetical protein n=1 Tax=Corynebacterium sp. 11A TaxID=2080510 RepID=UPI00124ED30E|nr:hypothetical protein [Corynebacterium sp. 11A]